MPAGNVRAQTLQLPNALWGSFSWAAGPVGYRDSIRARSSSVGDALCARVIEACKSWGSPSANFPTQGSYYQVPVIVARDPLSSLGGTPSEALRAELPPGVLAIAVKPMGTDHNGRPGALGYHAIYVDDDSFSLLDGQTCGLWGAGAFLERWDGNEELPLIEVEAGQAGPAEIGDLPDEQVEWLSAELKQVLMGGAVIYRCIGLTPESNEHLRVLQLGLPLHTRAQLGFGLFVASSLAATRINQRGVDRFAMAVIEGMGRFEAGRAQLLDPTRPAEGSRAVVNEYVNRYRDLVGSRDLAGVLALGREGLSEEGEPEEPGPSGRFR